MKSLFLIFASLFLILSNSSADTLSFEHYFKLGNSYSQKKEWDNAIEAYTHAIKINDEIAKVHYNLGLAYLHKWFEVRDKNMRDESYKVVKKLNDPNPYSTLAAIDGEDDITRELKEIEVKERKRTIELDDTIAVAHYM